MIKKKLSLKGICILVIITSVILSLLAFISGAFRKERVLSIDRPEFKNMQEVELEALIDGKKSYTISLKVDGRRPDKEESEKRIEKARDLLNKRHLGSNTDDENIRNNLYLPSYIEKYGVSIEWDSSDPETVLPDGQVINEGMNENEEKAVVIAGSLKSGQLKDRVEYRLKVKGPLVSSYDKQLREIESAVAINNEADISGEKVDLPSRVNGKSVEFFERTGNIPFWIFIPVGIAVCLLLAAREREKKKKAEKSMREELLDDYALLTCKLSIFYEAGISIFNSLQLVLKDYLDKRKNKTIDRRMAYENLLECLSRINNGMGEAAAYMRYGRDCRAKEYKKLGNYLSDNIKKGSGDLSILLENEVDEAFSKRKSFVRTKAEEAGTKMLQPMMIMLGIIMVIVMVPAMMSFWTER